MNYAMSALRFHFSPCISVALILVATATLFPTPARAVKFQPVSPEELKMTDEPKAPGAPAIILFRQVDRDDRGNSAHEDVYIRIKVLTEEGRRYGDVEIPSFQPVSNIHARTIKPDGSIVNFDGQIFEKSIEKARGEQYMAKTFALPDVQAGAIIEYYYTTDLGSNDYVFNSHWILSSELFTKSAKFTLRPYDLGRMNLRWSWNQLPAGTPEPAETSKNLFTLEARDIPAFQTEDYMPPENELKSRVDFIYSEEIVGKDPDKYWQIIGKSRNDELESFSGGRRGMKRAVGEIVAVSDSPEEKLHKIYARVQQLRNTSYELEKTQEEQKRSKEKDPEDVDDIWKKQYANGRDLTWLFLALVRAAGFEANGMWVSDRQNYFFSPQTMDAGRLDENIVVVNLNGKNIFCDPGAAFTPFCMLPWFETGVTGLKLDKDGGTWLQTTVPASAESGIHRTAALKLSDAGDLEGKLTVSYTGLEASERRVEQRLTDDADRKKFLENEVKAAIPLASDAELIKQPDWKSSTPPLVAEYTLKVPGWASRTGRRTLLPVGIFSATEKHLFDHSERVHPIYFKFPFQRVDDVSIEMPLGWQISTLPEPQKRDARAVDYSMRAENDKGTLHLNRTLDINVVLLDRKYYAPLRTFFQAVRTSDEQEVILQPAGTSAAN